MKNILYFILYCFVLGGFWSGCGAWGKVKLSDTEKSPIVPLDSFLVEMDEYEVVDSGFMHILDSLISYDRANGLVIGALDYTPIFISVGSVQREEYLLFEFGLTRAYFLEFPHPGYDPDTFVTYLGFGAMHYKGYLVKLSGLLDHYAFTDGKGNRRDLIKPTGKKCQFYTVLRHAEDGSPILDFRGRVQLFYRFKDGTFIYSSSTIWE
jgi:hypothetical protein